MVCKYNICNTFIIKTFSMQNRKVNVQVNANLLTLTYLFTCMHVS